MQKEDILFNEVNFAYGLAEPKKIALDGKSFELFIRAAMKYNVALYNYANKINNSM